MKKGIAEARVCIDGRIFPVWGKILVIPIEITSLCGQRLLFLV
jgi:hypothetical protein